VSEYSDMDFGSTSFDSNFALDGGAVYNAGISDIYDSTFTDNFSEDGVRRAVLEVVIMFKDSGAQHFVFLFLNSGWCYHQ
jgi:predicted outer membrane repeat protein